jgi:hypothetical protein
MYRLPDSASQYLIHYPKQNISEQKRGVLVQKRGAVMRISIGEQSRLYKGNRVLQQFIGATVAPE